MVITLYFPKRIAIVLVRIIPSLARSTSFCLPWSAAFFFFRAYPRYRRKIKIVIRKKAALKSKKKISKNDNLFSLPKRY